MQEPRTRRPKSIVTHVKRETVADDLAAETLAVLGRGDMMVWLASSRRAGCSRKAAEIVAREHPGAVGMRQVESGKVRFFWYPANVNPTAEVVGWWS